MSPGERSSSSLQFPGTAGFSAPAAGTFGFSLPGAEGASAACASAAKAHNPAPASPINMILRKNMPSPFTIEYLFKWGSCRSPP